MRVYEWAVLADDAQLMLSREAFKRAAATLAQQADLLAAEMENEALEDHGGPKALRLFAAVVRETLNDGVTHHAHVRGHA